MEPWQTTDSTHVTLQQVSLLRPPERWTSEPCQNPKPIPTYKTGGWARTDGLALGEVLGDMLGVICTRSGVRFQCKSLHPR